MALVGSVVEYNNGERMVPGLVVADHGELADLVVFGESVTAPARFVSNVEQGPDDYQYSVAIPPLAGPTVEP